MLPAVLFKDLSVDSPANGCHAGFERQSDHELFHGLVLAAKPVDLRRNFILGVPSISSLRSPVKIRELRDIACNSKARMCASSSGRQIESVSNFVFFSGCLSRIETVSQRSKNNVRAENSTHQNQSLKRIAQTGDRSNGRRTPDRRRRV